MEGAIHEDTHQRSDTGWDRKRYFINDGLIEEISENCTRNADRIVIAKNKAALPSLINGHTHAAMTLMRGYADDMQLQPWLEGKTLIDAPAGYVDQQPRGHIGYTFGNTGSKTIVIQLQ